jgi:hypothetical protein
MAGAEDQASRHGIHPQDHCFTGLQDVLQGTAVDGEFKPRRWAGWLAALAPQGDALSGIHRRPQITWLLLDCRAKRNWLPMSCFRARRRRIGFTPLWCGMPWTTFAVRMSYAFWDDGAIQPFRGRDDEPRGEAACRAAGKSIWSRKTGLRCTTSRGAHCGGDHHKPRAVTGMVEVLNAMAGDIADGCRSVRGWRISGWEQRDFYGRRSTLPPEAWSFCGLGEALESDAGPVSRPCVQQQTPAD